jgi:Putative peptidoglycan binding domain
MPVDPGEAQRFNKAHAPAGSPAGGQFATSTSSAGTKPAKTPKPTAHSATTPKAPTRLTKTLAYNAATDHGPGYGTRHGDAHVHQLQRALNRLGVTDASGHPLADDGKLGPLTTQAIKAAQKRLGLNPDGKVTPALYTRLLATKSLPAPLPRRSLEARESPAPHPGSAEKLHEYWVHGEGAAKIRWGEPGDFDRCTHQLEEHAHFTPEQAHGYCNLAHHAALGIYPATHAKLLGKHRALPTWEASGDLGDWSDYTTMCNCPRCRID